jgi:hypothetical protein
MQRSVKEKHIKLGARKRLNHFLSFRVRWNCKERSARVKCELRQRHQETTKKHPLISVLTSLCEFSAEMRAPRAQAALAIGSFVGISLQRIDSEAGAHRRKRPRSLEIYGPLVNETVAAAKALKQQRELASERTLSLHSIFPHTAHQTLGARTYLVSVPVSSLSQKRAP